MYGIRVWKYLQDNVKQLIDMITSDSQDFITEYYEEVKDLYSFWNYEIEKVGF